MKKLSFKQKERNDRRARNGSARKHRRHGNAGVDQSASTTARMSRRGPKILNPPAVFSLSENYAEVATFLAAFRHKALQGIGPRRRRLVVALRDIGDIDLAAALVLAAEMDRWRQVRHVRLVPQELDEWNPDVKRLLHDLGFFDLLGVTDVPEDMPSDGRQVFIRFRSGKVALGEKIKELRVAIEHVTGTSLTESRRMYDALVEAITNTRHHAYPEGGSYKGFPVLRGQWWLAGAFSPTTRRLILAAYDQGKGIPATLTQYEGWEQVRAVLEGWGHPLVKRIFKHDANMIRAAMTVSRTRTQLGERGQGLEKMRVFVEACAEGSLRILSGHGDYLYNKGGSEQVHYLSRPLEGTLIIWQVGGSGLSASEGTA